MRAQATSFLVPFLLLMAPCLHAGAQQITAPAQGTPSDLPTTARTIVIETGADVQPRVLPRIFYGPEERHQLELAEAAAQSDAHPPAKTGLAAAVRFNGWLSGPGPVRAWINGAPHVASGPDGELAAAAKPGLGESDRRDKRLSLQAEVPAADTDAVHARFDAATEQLVVVSGNGRQRRLRAGQSENQDSLLPLAGEGPTPASTAETPPRQEAP